jgi:hypothetical protein
MNLGPNRRSHRYSTSASSAERNAQQPGRLLGNKTWKTVRADRSAGRVRIHLSGVIRTPVRKRHCRRRSSVFRPRRGSIGNQFRQVVYFGSILML